MTHTPRTREQLDELEKRVYDLAVQPIPLAEIAVRLGVPVGQADDKVQRLLARLGVADRAALRRFDSGPEDPSEQAPEPEPIEPSPSKPLSRRQLVVGGASLAAMAAGGALGSQLAQRREQTPGAVPELPTSTPPALPSATPTPPPAGLHIEVEPGNLRFETAIFGTQDTITWEHGLFKMNPDNGDIEGLRFRALVDDESEPFFFNYGTAFDGRFIWAENGGDRRAYLADVFKPDNCWGWPADRVRLVTAYGANRVGYVVFEEMQGLSPRGNGRHTVFRIDDGSNNLEVAFSFELPPTGSQRRPLINRELIAMWAGDGESSPELCLVDLGKGVVLGRMAIPPHPDGFAGPFPIDLEMLDNERFLARWNYRDDTGAWLVFGAVFPWNSPTSWSMDNAIQVEWAASLHPTLPILVEEHTTRAFLEEGGGERWTELRVRHGDTDAFRLRSAATAYGDFLPQNRWLADGSGFVAMVRGPQTDGPNAEAYEYAIISADGLSVTRIPLPAAIGEPAWYNRNSMRAPVPSPYDPNLISFGRTDLHYVTPGAWLRPKIASTEGPAHLDPWVAGPQYMVFALPHLGHGGGHPAVLLDPKREEPPYADAFAFVVAGTGDSLRLRAEPSLNAPILANLPDGTKLSLVEDPIAPEGQRAVARADAITWVRVRTQNGEVGWVTSSYLNWQ